jgi:hypothetical protein
LQNRSGEKMMRKKLIAFLLVSIVISSIFFISTRKMTTAEECNDCNPIPTPPGDADYCKINPLKFSSIPNEISCGTPVTIKITGGKAPYLWQVSGNGFSISEISEREYSLSCDSGCTCGEDENEAGAVASLMITDGCGTEVTSKIRNTSGSWGAWQRICGHVLGSWYYGYPVGDRWYRVNRWGASTNSPIKCSDSCAAQILAEGPPGFPNEDGDYFSCIYYEGEYVFVVMPGERKAKSLVGYDYREWGCP